MVVFICFINFDYLEYKLLKEEELIDQYKYVILFSGGKDSLFIYGLVQELGEVYLVFVNELGWYWFIVVNVYCYFCEYEFNMVKFWMNCDCVFNWMLCFFLFIKFNYQCICVDIYLICMYIVVVFFFVVFFVVCKCKVGNVLIGNEYDIIMCGLQEGILYYYGLYDQSKYFDNVFICYYK